MSRQPLLIVDDEPQYLTMMRQILSAEYSLVFARSGEDALAATLAHRPRLILLDIQMPDMNGYEVCRQLKVNPETESIPVIFVTVLNDKDNEATGFSCGAVDYISKPFSPAIVLARVRTHLSLVRAIDLENSYRDAINMLGLAGHYSDSNTGDHIWRMAAYAQALAEAFGWDEEDSKLLAMAASMHDTGKIGIPGEVLRKPASLTRDEWEVMKTHTLIGYDILSKSDAPLFRLAADIALHHHENWDGSGYPHGLAGEAIPEAARIVAVADVFDALTMRRPYKQAWPVEMAMTQMHALAGNQLEARLVTLFESILPQILQIKSRHLEPAN